MTIYLTRLINRLLLIVLLLVPCVVNAYSINAFIEQSSSTHFCAESNDTVNEEDANSEDEEEEPDCD